MTWLVPDTNWLFIHIPKTGGTSVHKSLRQSYTLKTPQFDEETLKKNLWEGAHQTPPHIKIHQYRDLGLPLNEYQFFSQVRNPYTRIVSLYYFIKRQDLHKITGRVPEKNLRRDLDFYRERYKFFSSMLFKRFVELFTDASTRQELIDRWVVERTSQLEHGWTPQHCWLDGADVRVFKLEEHQQLVDFLKHLGCDFYYSVHKRQNIKDHMAHYDDTTRLLIYNHFKEDFKRYGYDR